MKFSSIIKETDEVIAIIVKSIQTAKKIGSDSDTLKLDIIASVTSFD